MNNKTLFILLAALFLVVGGFAVAQKKTNGGGAASEIYNSFAQCLTDSGAKFYGAFWCPHCKDQKRAFGKASELLPYIECSTPDRSGQLQECVDAGITGYPTWMFANGEQRSGFVPLESLAELSGCELPEREQ